MLWSIAVTFTKYAALAYLLMSAGMVTYLFKRSRNWRQAFSVLNREEINHYNGLPRRMAFTLKAIRFVRLSAATGASILLLLMIVDAWHQ